MDKFTLKVDGQEKQIEAENFYDALNKAHEIWPSAQIKVVDVEGENDFMKAKKETVPKKRALYVPDRVFCNLKYLK